MRYSEQQYADAFNRMHPEGTPVRYWPGLRTGEGRTSTTRGAAWVLPSDTAVVRVKGYPGGIALTHIEIAEPGGSQP